MPKNQVLSFSYDYYKIRAVVDSDNEPLFCLIDICRALEWNIKNTSNVISKIKIEFGLSTLPTHRFNTSRGLRNCVMITQTQLYFIILTLLENNTKVKEFKKWFEAEVLPNLEQNSQLQALPQVLPQQPKSYGEALIEAGKLALENEKLLTQTKENQLKIEVFDELMSICRDFIERVDETLKKVELVEKGIE